MTKFNRRQTLGLIGAAAAATTLPTPAIAQNKKIVVGALRFTSHSGSFIALERGYFADAGLDVELKFFQAAQPMAVAIASGDVDYVIGVTVWTPTTTSQVVLWLTAVLGIVGLRWVLCRSYHHDPGVHSESGWKIRYGGALAVAGLLWAWPVIFFFPEDPARQLLLTFALAGVATTAADFHRAYWWSFVAVPAPPLVALAARFASTMTSTGWLLSLLALGFLIGVATVPRRSRRWLSDSLALRFENGRLSAEVDRLNAALRERTDAHQRAYRELRRRDDILQAIRFAAERLLDSEGWETDPSAILERLGRAASVDHVYIVHHTHDEGSWTAERTFRWLGDDRGGAGLEEGSSDILFTSAHERWSERLRRGAWIAGRRSDVEPDEAELLDHHDVRSMAVFPILVDQTWWGVLGFEDSSEERAWTRAELEALASAASMLGAALQGMSRVEELATSDRRYRLLAENTTDLVCLHDPDGHLLYVSPSSELVLGRLPHQLLGSDPYELLRAEDRQTARRELHAPTVVGEVGSMTYEVERADGTKIWLETTTRPVLDDEGQLEVYVSASRDVTTRKLAEDQLFREKELAQVTLKSIGDGVVTTDADGRVSYANPVAQRLAGKSRRELVSRDLVEALSDGGPGAEVVADLVEQAYENKAVITAGEPVTFEDQAGNDLALEVSAAPILDREGDAIGTVTVLHDVTRTQALAEQLSYQASHDALTGLLNRRQFESVLNDSVRRRRHGENDVLCYLDLDQFKLVNDTCGHIAGDELLRQLAGVLRTVIRRSDVVARLGGDEFGILLTRCAIERAETVANGLCEAIRGFRFTWEGRPFQLGASIGVVPISSQGNDVTDLLSAADAACYAAKDRGRNRVHVFTPDDRVVAHRKGEMEWVAQLHSALEEDRFELQYQPILEAHHRRIEPARIEILLAMLNDDGERIPPGSFIPAAERFNTMPAIDRWVVTQAISSFAEHWRSSHRTVRECFINLSGTSLTDPSFGAFVKEQIIEHQVPAGVLCFEITETAAITNLAEATELMKELRAMGCRFALDDFGSGLSSFAYLRSLPVDFLKIDGMFVKDIHHDSVDHSIVESINRVGKMVGLKTIAEFVESPQVLEHLQALGVDFVQGYGLARPAPVKNLIERLGTPRRSYPRAVAGSGS